MKQNHLGISVKLWKLVYTALSSGRVLMFYLLHIFSWKRKEKKKKVHAILNELKTGGRHVLLKIIIQRGSNWNMFSYYCHMYRCVQEQKNWIQSICQWLVQSVLHSLQGWSWHGVREEAVYRYIQSLQVKNRNLEIQTYKKYVRIVKKCTWIESLQYRRAVLYWCNRFSCDWQLN